GAAPPPEVTAYDRIEALRPSRYCGSDVLGEVAAGLFAGLTGADLVRAGTQWALDHITYAPGSTGPSDGALDVYLRRRGVCRDSAHLLVAFFRALNLPARLVSCYAPGLTPMDFHAVVEVFVEGGWHVADGTGLAPRPSLVRIATGRDAADTAFLTVQGGRADLRELTVEAWAEDALPEDDGMRLVQLG
ncbi:transglutaminase-like domain-containing protein, partial [Nocardioides stalactiti]|uniref:transglutaminase-like domain-containing protein n=1 Tax=Nocardioides stalactiti TaxID=2755356 RepID=UPI00160233FE